MHRSPILWLLGLNALLAIRPIQAEQPSDQPRPVPPTRPEVKRQLEDMKARQPRIPLPPLTDAEKEKLGEQASNYESRLRHHYLPGMDSRGGFGFSREPDPAMTLDNPFKTEMFWIVSRTNNCQYCLGHQEMKLAVAGIKENEIAALDGDWSEFTPAQQAAFAWARKLTYEPHRLTTADVDALRKHYKDLQILEMTLSVAGNNAINRWKEGTGVPQSQTLEHFIKNATRPVDTTQELPTKSFFTPTADRYKTLVSKVAPLAEGATRRPGLETRAQVEQALAEERKRQPRLPLVDQARACELLPQDAGDLHPLPQWIRLLANFPKDGKNRINQMIQAESKSLLKPLLRAQVSWIIARQDRAWYAVDDAYIRLKNLGQTEEQIFQLDGDWSEFKPQERALFTLARKLAASPVVLTDADVSRAIELVGPQDVTQLIQYTTTRASFDRITEAAGLSWGDIPTNRGS